MSAFDSANVVVANTFKTINLSVKKQRTTIQKSSSKKAGSHICNYLGCLSTFTNRFNLRRHIMLTHCKNRPFKCEYCSKRFGLLQYYREHLLLHTSFQEVDKRLKEVNPSVLESLPIFRVESVDDKQLIHEYIKFTPLPTFMAGRQLPGPC